MRISGEAAGDEGAGPDSGRASLPPFEPMPWAEQLLELRERDFDAFMLRTSESTRLSLQHYERWKATARASA